jgi:hypothetical protein
MVVRNQAKTRKESGHPDEDKTSHDRNFIGARNLCSRFLERVAEKVVGICATSGIRCWLLCYMALTVPSFGESKTRS